MKRTLLVLGVILALAAPAAASEYMGVQGLDVSLYQDANLVYGPVITDEEGIFSLIGVNAGPYSLLVKNLDQSLTLKFPLEVAEADSTVTGKISATQDLDVGYRVVARVTSEAGTTIVTKAAIRPPKWNLSSMGSMGNLKVHLWGTGLEGINKVTLKIADEEISSMNIMVGLDEEGNQTAKAFFKKADVYGTLVPPGTPNLTKLNVTVVIEAGGVVIDSIEKKVTILVPPKK